MNYPFDTTELATLDSGDSLSTIVQLRGLMRGIQIENRTPAFWQVVDDSGTVWFKIPPWSITQGRFPESQQVVIETEANSPLFSLSTVTDTEYRLGYELFREALPYQVMNLVTGLVQLMGSNVAYDSPVNTVEETAYVLASGDTYIGPKVNTVGTGIIRTSATAFASSGTIGTSNMAFDFLLYDSDGNAVGIAQSETHNNASLGLNAATVMAINLGAPQYAVRINNGTGASLTLRIERQDYYN